jgi:omega-6 fatty acid desaturase (delta-12 desaturase)
MGHLEVIDNPNNLYTVRPELIRESMDIAEAAQKDCFRLQSPYTLPRKAYAKMILLGPCAPVTPLYSALDRFWNSLFADPGCTILPSIDRMNQQRRAIMARHAQSDDVKGLSQSFTTLASIALLWWVAIVCVDISLWLTAAAMLLLTLFNVRVFALMHECGHGSLFRSRWLNRAIGFVFGVISGMPQYVWSQHHNYHHAHNGNWEKYRGPYTTLSLEEYESLSDVRQRLYRYKCGIAAAPVAGFIYLIFNPRFNWIKGTLSLVRHIIRNKMAQPTVSFKTHAAGFETRYWKSAKEYWHMFWNNVVLLGIWVFMCSAFGTVPFFTIYLISLSIAGGAGIILFTVQHNFEHSYASDCKRWDYTTGAIKGTCILMLPRWLNWFTVDMGYHHIHHFSANIPNYCLAQCHNESRHLFADVRRLKLSQIPSALKYILWDTQAQRIISVAEYHVQTNGMRLG